MVGGGEGEPPVAPPPHPQAHVLSSDTPVLSRCRLFLFFFSIMFFKNYF